MVKHAAMLSVALALAVFPAPARETQTVPDGTGRFMSNVGDIGGRSRVFLTYVPKSLKPGAPLLIMFHGGGGDGPMARLGTGGVYDHLADRDGRVGKVGDDAARRLPELDAITPVPAGASQSLAPSVAR